MAQMVREAEPSTAQPPVQVEAWRWDRGPAFAGSQRVQATQTSPI